MAFEEPDFTAEIAKSAKPRYLRVSGRIVWPVEESSGSVSESRSFRGRIGRLREAEGQSNALEPLRPLRLFGTQPRKSCQ